MLDRQLVEEFLDEELENTNLEIPAAISNSALVETFCRYVEDDYYEWLKDNFNSFFNHNRPIWDWIRDRIEYYRNP
jgi:hypothetical protein